MMGTVRRGLGLVVAAVLGGWAILALFYRAPGSGAVRGGIASDGQPDVAVRPWAPVDGDAVTIHDVRDNDYRTEGDYTVRHEDRRLSLAALSTMDLFLSHSVPGRNT